MTNDEMVSFSPAAAILNTCRQLIRDFVIANIAHCLRESNEAVDELARQASGNSPGSWLDDTPGFLLPKLVHDMTIID